jgi:P27 family predicted phage terminase small subunit
VRGRKPKPTQLKVVSGNPGKRSINENEPQPVSFDLTAPDWFDDLQRDYWNDAVSSAPPGLLSTMDREVLAVWVVSAVMHRRAVVAQNAIDEGKTAPMLTKTPGGMPVQSPYISIINKQSAVMLKAAAEMGFTPSSRSRISLGSRTDDDNPFVKHKR